MKKLSWIEKAIEYIKKYPHTTFKTEDVRTWAYGNGLEKHKNPRAWGNVVLAAKSKGLIKKVGFILVDNPNAHRTPASMWKKI